VIGTRYVDANGLGKHHYSYSFSENGGIAYTCRGGHIDIDHVRIAADYTKYLSEKAYSHLIKGDKEFTFGLNVDPSQYFVTLQYPQGWESLPTAEKKKISHDAAIELGSYLTFVMVSWHEVLTWYGFHTVGVLPEFPSAFSWEDSYSNLLGVRVSAQALQESPNKYDEAFTMLLKRELESLGVQSKTTSKQASEQMRGKWFTGIFLPDIKERNFDLGLENGYVTPTLVPGLCPGESPQSLPVPALDQFHKHGFKIELEVEPRVWEQGRIYKALARPSQSNRIKLPQDFALFRSPAGKSPGLTKN
jgi:hypothetical protein